MTAGRVISLGLQVTNCTLLGVKAKGLGNLTPWPCSCLHNRWCEMALARLCIHTQRCGSPPAVANVGLLFFLWYCLSSVWYGLPSGHMGDDGLCGWFWPTLWGISQQAVMCFLIYFNYLYWICFNWYLLLLQSGLYFNIYPAGCFTWTHVGGFIVHSLYHNR